MKLIAPLLLMVSVAYAQDLRLPNKRDSVRFAVIGDSGTGDKPQYETAAQLARWFGVYPFEFVIMMGDNLYGSEKPRDYEEKFERPYAVLLRSGVRFHASLGNHDDQNQRYYAKFNMNGERFYTFSPRKDVSFFALDSTYMGPEQLEWLNRALATSDHRWKIVFFHHALYSSGRRHGPNEELRALLEPIFVRHAVSAVFSGHEHFYERIWPQKGIPYFIVGASGKLRRGNVDPQPQTAAHFDEDRSFLLVEITESALHFQAVSRTGATVDWGVAPLALGPRSTSPPTGEHGAASVSSKGGTIR